jgi:hypothetical protein
MAARRPVDLSSAVTLTDPTSNVYAIAERIASEFSPCSHD